ncbi:hypothetical protein IK112_01875 [Candidatus Saccharibacteria bacterium]|nr:hypothetical protein [Candidatus Saccharibacteria bacterium]
MHATRFSSHSTGARRHLLSYVFSGLYYWGGYLDYQGSLGNWWSTTASSASNAYNLDMNSSLLRPQSSSSKAYGFSLRCTFCFTFSRRYPLSYVISGRYFWNEGKLYGQGNDGDVQFMSSTSISDTQGSGLVIYGSVLDTQRGTNKLHSINLRSTIARRYPLSYVLSGFFYWGNNYGLAGLGDQGTGGHLHSATPDSGVSDNMYYLYITGSNVIPQGNNNKTFGFALLLHFHLFPSVSAFVCMVWSVRWWQW